MAKMENLFPEFYLKELTSSDLKTNNLIVLDSNILLDVLRLPSAVSKKYMEAIEKSKNSIFIPYIVGLEFNFNKKETKIRTKQDLEKYEERISESIEKLKDKILKSVFHFISNQGDIQSKIMFKELLKRIEDSTSFLSSFIKEQERLRIKSRKPIFIISELLAFNDNLYKLLQNEYSLIFPDFFKKKEEVISVRPENNIPYKSDIFRNKEAEAWFYSMLEEFNVSNGERGFGAVIGGIFRNSNCKNHILKSHLKQKEYIQYLNERFNKTMNLTNISNSNNYSNDIEKFIQLHISSSPE